VTDTLPDRTLTVHHFTHSNLIEAGADGVPALLRRVAHTVRTLGRVEVVDMTFRTEATPDGDWASMTVYYHRLDDV
jgi:hypothetical protein